MIVFEVEDNIEIEFYKPTLIWYASKKTYANKIGISEVQYVEIGHLVTIITYDYDRIIIAPLSKIKSINYVDNLSVNQFGEPIEREGLE